MLKFKQIFFIIGLLLVLLSICMLCPLFVDLHYGGKDWISFFISVCITLFFGIILSFANKSDTYSFSLRQVFLLTTLSWFVISLFGAIPFMISSIKLSFIDALFESVSGFTTTGATVIVGLDYLPRGILIWRSFIQWLGGIGIIVIALAVLPMLKTGSIQLFRSESSDKSEKVLPRARHYAFVIAIVYLLLTILCVICLMLAHIEPFEAVAHAFTTISTAGFSTKDSSIAWFQNQHMEVIIIIFMILSSLPFILYFQMLNKNIFILFKDSQVKFFVLFYLGAIIISLFWMINKMDYSSITAIRTVIFNITSVITTTGFSSDNYNLWGDFMVLFIFLLPFVGGCTGSTSGGIKIFRIQILLKSVNMQIQTLLEPHGVFKIKYNNNTFQDSVKNSIESFFIVFIMFFVLISLLLSLSGLDYLTSISMAMAAITNLGPGLGDIIGPSGNYHNINIFAKCVMIVGMIIGRLEIFTILVLFSRKFWND